MDICDGRTDGRTDHKPKGRTYNAKRSHAPSATGTLLDASSVTIYQPDKPINVTPSERLCIGNAHVTPSRTYK